MAAHLLEAAVVGALLAHEDRVHRRLHVVVDPARAGALVEGEGPVVRVEHHLLGLAGISPNERHPAVTEPHMRDLHRHGDAVDQHDLVAPVELVRLARLEAQRHEGRRRPRASRPSPSRGVSPDGVVPAFVAQTAEVLVDPQQRYPIPAAPRGIRGQQPIELVPPGAELRLGLDAALVLKGGLLRPQNLPDNLPRQLQLTADLLDRLSLNKMCPADLGDRLHNQHPKLGSRYPREHCEPHRQGGPFWKPITPETGSLLRASPQRCGTTTRRRSGPHGPRRISAGNFDALVRVEEARNGPVLAQSNEPGAAPRLSDDGLAQAFVAQHRSNWRYVAA